MESCSRDNDSPYNYEEDQNSAEQYSSDNTYEYSYEELEESYSADYTENANANQDFRSLCNLIQVVLSIHVTI